MNITAKTKMCVIIGDPVQHSLSPAMHNAAYAALGIDRKFIFTAAHVRPDQLEAAVAGVRSLGIRGLTCTIPHKIAVMPYLDHIDPVAQKIGAVNTVVNDNGSLTGFNTDWLGTVAPLEAITPLAGKKVALLGAGGAARAIAYGVTQKEAQLTVYNRTLSAAQALAEEFGGTGKDLSDLSSIAGADIIINSTSVGMCDTAGTSLVPANLLQPHQIVFDAIYKPHETKLLQDAKARGARIIYGYQMLLHQGVAQFELYTSQKPPVAVMLDIITKHL